jgi:hypothetical protein
MVWQEAYSDIGTLWAVRDAAHPNGHRGQDFAVPGGSVVPAYEECLVVNSSDPTSLYIGNTLVARAVSDGRFLGWAHLVKGTRPGEGVTLYPGDQVGLVADGSVKLPTSDPNFPGTSWDGAHIHATVGPTIDSIYEGQTFDPLPRIKKALAGWAGSDTTPIPPVEEPVKKDNDMPRIYGDADDPQKRTYLLAPGFIYCHEDGAERDNDIPDLGPIWWLNNDAFKRKIYGHGFAQIGGTWGDATWRTRLPKPGQAFIEPAGTKNKLR